jgi:hypothetical protein
MDLTLAQKAALGLELTLFLAGAALLVRSVAVDDVRRRWYETNNLRHWQVTGLEVGLLIVFAFLCALAGQVALYSLYKLAGESHPDHQTLQVLFAGLGLHGAALCAWPLWRRQFQGMRAGLDPTPPELTTPKPALSKSAAAALGAVLCALPCVYLLSVGWQQLLTALGLPAEPQDIVDIFANAKSGWTLAGLVVLACVIAPINEELIFRHALYRFGRQRFGRALALTVTSLLFGASHLNLAGALPLALLGAGLALAYEKTGDIRVPIIAHGLFNLNTVALILLGLHN